MKVSTWTEGGKAKRTDQPQNEFKPKGKHTRPVSATSGFTPGGGPGDGILGLKWLRDPEDGVRGDHIAQIYTRKIYAPQSDRRSES